MMLSAPFEFRGSAFSLPVFQVNSDDLSWIQQELEKRLLESQQFFMNAPLVIDLAPLSSRTAEEGDSVVQLNLAELVRQLRQAALLPVGIIHGTAEMEQIAVKEGLAVLHASSQHGRDKKTPTRNRRAPRTPTMVVGHPVRAGQQVYAQGGDLVVLNAVNAGAEVAADGDIHIYGAMRGKALAGAMGDTQTNIFCQAFAGEMLVIAGHYRTFESNPQSKASTLQAWLENEQLMVAPIECI